MIISLATAVMGPTRTVITHYVFLQKDADHFEGHQDGDQWQGAIDHMVSLFSKFRGLKMRELEPNGGNTMNVVTSSRFTAMIMLGAFIVDPNKLFEDYRGIKGRQSELPESRRYGSGPMVQ
jgi:hypothetical protein